MAATIKIKNSSTASAVPTSSDLVQGELAVNVTDKRIFTENASGTVVELGINPSTITTATVNGLTVGKGAGSVSTNTAVGASALAANTTGSSNSASGYQALKTVVGGSDNTAFGTNSLRDTSSGNSNTGIGSAALIQNTTGASNTAVGQAALFANTTASNNTAVGYQAGYSLTTSGYNTMVGERAGTSTTGVNNTFIGQEAGNTVTSGTKNTIIGRYNGNAGGLDIRTASNYIVLSDGDGNPRGWFDNGGNIRVPATASNTTSIAANMWCDPSTGYYARSTSALKYKQDIRDLEEVDINLFRPVRYKSKCEMDDQTKDHFGIIADEVDAAGIKELVAYNADGEVEGFQYERLTVVLLKELQTLKAKVTALENQ